MLARPPRPQGTKTYTPSHIRPKLPALQAALSAPSTPTNPATPQQPAAPQMPDTGLDSDPILAQIRALSERRTEDASAAALAAKKSDLIGYGYDSKLQGLYPDEYTAQAAHENPFSTLAQLQHAYQIATRNQDESLNKANLFYSGERTRDLAEGSRSLQFSQAQAAEALRSALSQLDSQVASVRDQSAESEINAAANAYTRQLGFSLQTGSGGAGSGFNPSASLGGAPSASGSPLTKALLSPSRVTPKPPIAAPTKTYQPKTATPTKTYQPTGVTPPPSPVTKTLSSTRVTPKTKGH